MANVSDTFHLVSFVSKSFGFVAFRDIYAAESSNIDFFFVSLQKIHLQLYKR